MRRRRAVGLVGTVVLVGTLCAPSALGDAEKLRTLSYLPPDALLVLSTRMDSLATPYDALLGLIRDLAPSGDVDEGLASLGEWEAGLGLSLRDDLLAQLGRELSVAVSIDDLDRVAAQITSLSSEAPPDLEGILGGILLVVGVKDDELLDASLGRLVGAAGGRIDTGDDGVRTVQFSLGGREMDLVHYRYHRGFGLFGFGRRALADAVRRSETGNNLPSAAVYREVFSHFDPGPDTINYLNLSRVQELLQGSNLFKVIIAQEPSAQKAYHKFVEELDWGSGVGWAAYSIPEGTLWQGFAPFDMWAFANLYMGAVSAVAVPNFLEAMDRGRQKRTLSDIRSVAVAVEAYAVDHGRYPPNILTPTMVGGGGDENLEKWLAPIYIRELPVEDGWGNPILYSSDPRGNSYKIYSPGKDGKLSAGTTGATRGFDGDIILKNGHFIAWPEGMEP